MIRLHTHLLLGQTATTLSHAVICDGAAMQRVPGSLRYVTKICREAKIPLYILNDPRSWGSQTHATLSDAIVDMQKTVTDNVVSTSFHVFLEKSH